MVFLVTNDTNSIILVKLYKDSWDISQPGTEIALGVSNGYDFLSVRSFKGPTKNLQAAVLISLIVMLAVG